MIQLREIESPIGPLTIAARGGKVCLLHFGATDDRVRRWLAKWFPSDSIEPHHDPARSVEKLRAYFDGDLDVLDTIDVELHGTPFQQRVWTALRQVRAGRTASYSEIARAIDAASAVRAVGAANGANPVAVIVPCHRIIGTNGSLTGYGGGLDRKLWLLKHEQTAFALTGPGLLAKNV